MAGKALLRAVCAAIWIAGASGCGSADGPTMSSGSAIYAGARDDGDDAVVALRIGDGSTYRLCTGALIAPNVVLTARHCTSVSAVETIGCTASGQSTNGDQFAGDVSPSSIHVYVGSAPMMASAAPAATGDRVFRPSSNALCNTDIALVVLNKNISGVRPLAVRLSSGVRAGDTVRSVGYGENDASYTSGVRFSKPDVGVLAVGAGVQKDGTVLGEAEFEVGRATCQGDSGGPAISMKTGAIVGVASRGVSCSLDYGHIYDQPAAFTSLFDEAFMYAGGGPIEEARDPSAPGAPIGENVAAAHGCDASSGSPRGDALVVLLALGLIARRRR